MKISDGQKPILNVAQVRALPEFGKLKSQQQKFVLLIAGGAAPIEAVLGAYGCTSQRSGERFLAGLLNRRSLQPILNLMFGLKDDSKLVEFMQQVDKLVRRGSRVTDAEIKTLILYGAINDLLPPDFHEARLEKFEKSRRETS